MKVFGSCFCGLDEPKVICLHVRQALVHILAILLELKTLSSFNLPKSATKSYMNIRLMNHTAADDD